MLGLDWIIGCYNSVTQLSSHSLCRCKKFIYALFCSTKWEKKGFFILSSSLTELTAQCSKSIGVTSLGCETNVSNVPDPNQESDSGVRVTRGYVGPLWMNRQGTVNLEDQEPMFCVFTSLLLQVMSSRCKKIQFSAAPSFCYFLRA